MADIPASRPWGGADKVNPEQITALSKATYAIGSIVSVGLVIGMGVWGYKLLVRDVSGVPVIRAFEGPARVQPEDPGGQQSQNQGLSVNDVAAVGTAGSAPDELILAPPPLTLSEEDAPQEVVAQTQTNDAAVAAQANVTPARLNGQAGTTADSAATDVIPPRSEDDESAAMLALAEALSSGVEPLSDLDAAPEVEVAAAAVSGEGIGRSLRPKVRPSGLRTVQTVAAVAAPSETSAGSDTTTEVAADSIPAGTRLAQLGAYASEDIARAEWARLSGQFSEYLSGKSRVIQRATSGGRTFYRLRAVGFDDLADARRFCSALVAERAECIPVVTR
ncbi:SPOR domain-containing protein [Rhodobacteraceae bacterium KMM 6894]|nr:SPOR domain-containing protein [Rhodobacteraceae bacterium KMM 6894]